MFKSRMDIAELYKESLITEMTHEAIEALDDWVDYDNLPFDNLFGKDLRIAVPIVKDPQVNDLMSALRSVDNFAGVDLKKGIVKRKIKIPEEHGGGEKEQEINLGRALQRSRLDPEKRKQLMDWYALYKDEVNEDEESEYTMIISRAPIDTIRMSDFCDINSCHSPDRGEFDNAVEEAITGGGTAFTVRTSELKEFLEDGGDLQLPDVFVDYDRGLDDDDHLIPISRLRFRRISNYEMGELENTEQEGAMDLALPEDAVYGKNIPFAYETLKNHLMDNQTVSREDFTNPENKWYLRGGGYVDSSVVGMARRYFDGGVTGDDDKYRGRHKGDSDHQRNYAGDIAILGNNLERLIEEWWGSNEPSLEYGRINYNVHQDTEMAHVDVDVEYTIWLKGVDIGNPNVNIAISDGYEMEKGRNGEYNDEGVDISGLIYWIENHIFDNPHSMTLYRLHVNLNEGNPYIEFVATNDMDSGYIMDVVEFEDWVYYAEKADETLSALDDDEWLELYSEIGIVNTEDITNFRNELTEYNISGGGYGEVKANNTYYFEVGPIDHDPGYGSNAAFGAYPIALNFAIFLRAYTEDRLYTGGNFEQQKIMNLEQVSAKMDKGTRRFYYDIDITDILLDIDITLQTGANRDKLTPVNVGVEFVMSDGLTEESNHFIKFVDQNKLDIINLLKIAFMFQNPNLRLPEYERLYNTYKKYLEG
jgi:hypothetical protein